MEPNNPANNQTAIVTTPKKTEQLTPAMEENIENKCKEIFDTIDKDGSGKINPREFAKPAINLDCHSG